MVGPLVKKIKVGRITRSSRAAKAPPDALVYHRGYGYYSLYSGTMKGKANLDKRRRAKTKIPKEKAKKYGHKGDVSRVARL
jgi:hypothetical protein